MRQIEIYVKGMAIIAALLWVVTTVGLLVVLINSIYTRNLPVEISQEVFWLIMTLSWLAPLLVSVSLGLTLRRIRAAD